MDNVTLQGVTFDASQVRRIYKEFDMADTIALHVQFVDSPDISFYVDSKNPDQFQPYLAIIDMLRYYVGINADTFGGTLTQTYHLDKILWF